MFSLIQSPSKCSGMTVGRMPMATMPAWASAALAEARLRDSRSSCSSSMAESPGSGRGWTLSSML